MSKDEHSYFGSARLDKVFWDDEDVGVITQGTGFFRPHFKEYHPYGQAREWAFRATNPIIITASAKFSIDEGFLRACILHLAELAVAHHESVEVFHFAKSDYSKADRRVVLSGYSKAVQKLKNLLIAIKTTITAPKRLKKRWDEIKGSLEHDPKTGWERYIDEAFSRLLDARSSVTRGDARSNLIVQLEKCLEFQVEEIHKRGRPTKPQMLKVLSGIDHYLESETGKPRRRLLAELIFHLSPELPIVRQPEVISTKGQSNEEIKRKQLKSMVNKLRSVIHARRKRGWSGEADLRALKAEWKSLRIRFFNRE